MSRRLIGGVVASLVLLVFASASQAQTSGSDVYWHIDPSVKTCSMVIDASLTQAQWHRFTKQASAILSFKSLASANTLGRMNFTITVDNGYTPVDQHDLAWINTFTHPDENCPLGDAISYPTIRAGMGLSDDMDVGAYWTEAPKANYGMVGGEFKYAFLRETERMPAAAARVSVSILTGVPDFNFSVYSLDVIASKKLAMFNPYVGLRGNLAVATETTSKVDLNDERIVTPQGYAGVVYSIWMINAAAEYDVSSLNTFAFAVGFGI